MPLFLVTHKTNLDGRIHAVGCLLTADREPPIPRYYELDGYRVRVESSPFIELDEQLEQQVLSEVVVLTGPDPEDPDSPKADESRARKIIESNDDIPFTDAALFGGAIRPYTG